MALNDGNLHVFLLTLFYINERLRCQHFHQKDLDILDLNPVILVYFVKKIWIRQKDLDIGPETNVNSVLAATATFYFTCFAANKWATKKTDKCRRNFLWAGDEEGHGGKSMVYWLKI